MHVFMKCCRTKMYDYTYKNHLLRMQNVWYFFINNLRCNTINVIIFYKHLLYFLFLRIIYSKCNFVLLFKNYDLLVLIESLNLLYINSILFCFNFYVDTFHAFDNSLNYCIYYMKY